MLIIPVALAEEDQERDELEGLSTSEEREEESGDVEREEEVQGELSSSADVEQEERREEVP